MESSSVIVRRRKVANVLAGEPWVYPNAIIEEPETAGLVRVVTEDDAFIGWADHNPIAPVRARLLWRDDTWPGEETLLLQRVQQALWRRISLGMQPQGNGLRLVNGEGDGLSGLVVDVFGGTMVIDIYSAGMRGRVALIKAVLQQYLGDLKIKVRMSADAAKRENVDPIDPEAGEICFAENGVLFRFDVGSSQKSGFYLDQRDNRRLIAGFARDRRVLDLFSYHGGFSLTALAAGAQSALAIDSSEAALECVQQNALANGLVIQTQKADVFDHLDTLISSEEHYDCIICDPPKLAPRKTDKARAMKAYRFLVDRCLKLLMPGGVLMVCSCSQAIGIDDLQRLLSQQSDKQKAQIDVLAVGGQPSDHPWPIAFQTGRYLSAITVHRRAMVV
jgi:23S rRNA (cytosine1962-C5)-methyltransferase